MGARVRVAMLAVLAGAACTMTSEHGGRFSCDDDHRCPEGQTCRDGFCDLVGSIDAAPEFPGYQAEVLSDHPIGYWPLDEVDGAVAVDASGNGHDGTYAGAPGLGAGGAAVGTGASVSLDGVDDYMGIADAPELRLHGSFTIEAWIRADGAPTSDYPGLVVKDGVGGYILYYYLWVDDHQRPSFVRAEGTELAVTAPSTLAEDRFRHYAIVHDETEALLTWYVDGVIDATFAVAYDDVENLAPIEVGRNNVNYALVSIDELAIYGAALTPARLLAHVEAAAL